jgi:cell division protein FtsI (penicillin-binding protein 3)
VTGEVVREAVPKVRWQAVSKQVARTMTEMLVAVTEGEGTGVAAAINGFQVAGKTATAQKIDPATGKYSPDNFIASFVGIAPARNAALVIAVTLDEPMIDHAGGAVAAPTFRRIADFSLKYLGLVPHGVKQADLAELSRSADPARATQAIFRQATGKPPTIQETAAHVTSKGLRIPDMTGWPAREVMKKIAELGMVPKITGSGLVARQSPQPGQPVAAGQELLIELEPAS